MIPTVPSRTSWNESGGYLIASAWKRRNTMASRTLRHPCSDSRRGTSRWTHRGFSSVSANIGTVAPESTMRATHILTVSMSLVFASKHLRERSSTRWINRNKTASPGTSIDLSICKTKVQICRQDINSAFQSAAKSFIWQATVLLESGAAVISSADLTSGRHSASSAEQASVPFPRPFSAATYPAEHSAGFCIAVMISFWHLMNSSHLHLKDSIPFFFKRWMIILKMMPQLKRYQKGKILTS